MGTLIFISVISCIWFPAGLLPPHAPWALFGRNDDSHLFVRIVEKQGAEGGSFDGASSLYGLLEQESLWIVASRGP